MYTLYCTREERQPWNNSCNTMWRSYATSEPALFVTFPPLSCTRPYPTLRFDHRLCRPYPHAWFLRTARPKFRQYVYPAQLSPIYFPSAVQAFLKRLGTRQKVLVSIAPNGPQIKSLPDAHLELLLAERRPIGQADGQTTTADQPMLLCRRGVPRSCVGTTD
jgi:hypothetical protein